MIQHGIVLLDCKWEKDFEKKLEKALVLPLNFHVWWRCLTALPFTNGLKFQEVPHQLSFYRRGS